MNLIPTSVTSTPTFVSDEHDDDFFLCPLLEVLEPDSEVCETPPVEHIKDE